MALDVNLLNTQHYKVRIMGKVDQSWERSSALLLHLGIEAIENGALGSPSTTVANFTLYSNNRDQETEIKEMIPGSFKNLTYKESVNK